MSYQTYLTTSRGIARDAHLLCLLHGEVRRTSARNRRREAGNASATAVIGWGNKPNTAKARALAEKLSLPYIRLEDGFVSYLGHPSLGDRRFSVIADHTGIYYDATCPSDLEDLLNQPTWLTDALLERAEQMIVRIRRHGISKYNHQPRVLSGGLQRALAGSPNNVLVIDQTAGDCSVRDGLADSSSFHAMLSAALSENPEAIVWVRVHPDVLLGKRQGHYDVQKLQALHRVKLLSEDVCAHALMPYFRKVYTVTSQLGFEAILHNKPVVCFGVPFYSGWGLTDDRVPCNRRRQSHTLASLFAAAYLKYCRYVDPETGEPCDLEDLIPLLACQRRMASERVNILYAVGFSLWKRAFVRDFVRQDAGEVRFVRTLDEAARKARPGDGIVHWGIRALPAQLPDSIPVWRMEDGFIRSVGLGVELHRPLSLVLDHNGIYYDGTRPSDLEYLLAHHAFTEAERALGRELLAMQQHHRISKYNLTGAVNIRKGASQGQRVILVPGQVQNDASLRWGCVTIRTNRELLETVRKEHPDAWLVYKPHPDVVSGNRDGRMGLDQATAMADRVITSGDIHDCIAQADEVHVLTSLTGFEALCQGKPVTTYGLPFYAGWGLTTDHCTSPRRGRCIDIEELVWAVLAGYPRYVNPQTRRPTTAMRTMAALVKQRGERQGYQAASGWLGRRLRKLRYLADTLQSTYRFISFR